MSYRLVKLLLQIVGDPRMIEQLLDTWSFCLVTVQALHYEILGLTRDVSPIFLRGISEFDLLVADIEVDLLDAPTLKGCFTT